MVILRRLSSKAATAQITTTSRTGGFHANPFFETIVYYKNESGSFD